MSKRVLVPLAEGFEEIEAVTAIDVLRRAEIEVVVAGLEPGPVRGSRGVVVTPDEPLAEVVDLDFDAVVLPGGGPGSQALAGDERVGAILKRHAAAGHLVAAICAAPGVVLTPLGLLEGKRATGYPGLRDKVPGWVDEPVVRDGDLITSQGPGTAMTFALSLVEVLVGAEKADEVAAAALAER
jgi:4-methyl-5(b-hydroxyethyl)-thiazole monophosphate biosynthesis